jgi:hypothetical protein
MKDKLVGTWTLISWQQKAPDGTTLRQFGPNPKGIAFFDASNRFVITVMRSDRANYAIDNFGQIAQSTAEDNKATAQGSIAYFGTYSVTEGEQAIAIHIEASSFPNWNDTDQKRFVTIHGDELTLTVRPPGGGSVDVLWKRAG